MLATYLFYVYGYIYIEYYRLEDGHFLVLLFPFNPTHPICLQAKVGLLASAVTEAVYLGIYDKMVAMTSIFVLCQLTILINF